MTAKNQRPFNSVLCTNCMNKTLIIFSLIFLTSCSTSDENISLNGTWARCYAIATDTYLYDELIINNTSFESTTFSAQDDSCTIVERQPEAGKLITIASISLGDTLSSINNLTVYELTLKNMSRESNIGITTLPDLYTIIHIDNDKLYFGKANEQNDGSTPELRYSEINITTFLTKI